MLKITAAVVSVLACMAFLVTNGWGLDLQAGEYEIISTVEMPGMPMQMPPVTIIQCLTSQDPVPNQSTAGQQCNIIEMKTEGDTVTMGHGMQPAGSKYTQYW